MKCGIPIFFSGGCAYLRLNRFAACATEYARIWFVLTVMGGDRLDLDFEEFGNLPRFPNSPLTGLTRLG